MLKKSQKMGGLQIWPMFYRLTPRHWPRDNQGIDTWYIVTLEIMTALFRFYIFCWRHFYRKHGFYHWQVQRSCCASLSSQIWFVCFVLVFFLYSCKDVSICQAFWNYLVLNLLFFRYCMVRLLIIFSFSSEWPQRSWISS